MAILFASSFVIAGQNSDLAAVRAAEFNRWYIGQINADKYPITDSSDIEQYVTRSTLKKLRQTQETGYSGEFYEADIFTKSQYIGDDWQDNVKAVGGDTDPVCVNVYIEFGKKEPHTVIDCMTLEDGRWKVQSVASLDFSRNLK